MAGVIGWSAYSDFDIRTSGIVERNDGVSEETAELIEEGHLWARDAQTTAWFGLDAKATLTDRVQLALRTIFDPASIPDSALSPNNWDANKVHLAGGVAANLSERFMVAIAYSHQFIAERTVTNSAFSVSVDSSVEVEDRYSYPSTNGTYTGALDRVAVTLSSGF